MEGAEKRADLSCSGVVDGCQRWWVLLSPEQRSNHTEKARLVSDQEGLLHAVVNLVCCSPVTMPAAAATAIATAIPIPAAAPIAAPTVTVIAAVIDAWPVVATITAVAPVSAI